MSRDIEDAPHDRPVWVYGGTYDWGEHRVTNHRWWIAQWNIYLFEWRAIAFGDGHMDTIEEISDWAPIDPPPTISP